MPELPDVELYVGALRPRIVGQTIRAVRLATPFLLRSVEPINGYAEHRWPKMEAARSRVEQLRRTLSKARATVTQE